MFMSSKASRREKWEKKFSVCAFNDSFRSIFDEKSIKHSGKWRM